MVSFKLAILALAGISHCSAKDMPDCSVAKNKSSAECICRLPKNWSESICQGPKWFGDPERQEDSEAGIRIVGGIPVDAGVYPWFARSTFRGGWGGCGGSLVTPEYVLTAAHCIVDDDNISSLKNNGGYQIGALCAPYGPNATSNCGQKVESFGIKDIIMHPSYNEDDSLTNDFALVRLDGRSSITPVPMDTGDVSPQYETESSKENLWPIGFGDLESGSREYPTDLMHVNINYVKQEDCKRAYPRENIGDNMLCAADSGQDSCQGDSGGPLYDSDNDTLVGVVSWGYFCADDQFPGVYARISDQISWIQQTICESHSSPKPAFCSSLPPPPPPPACVDSPVGWNDIDGSFYDCEWYAQEDYCERFGDLNELKNLGKTANEACCGCGGGLDNNTCTDSPGWHGKTGTRFNCDWYAQGDRCAKYGGNERYRNFGKTANEACCACSDENDDIESRIVGGTKVDANVYPWFARAYFFRFPEFFGGCGGSLVTPEYVLTAAHCIKYYDFETRLEVDNEPLLRQEGGYQIGALCDPYGPDSSSNCDQAVEPFTISDITLHPEYVSRTFENDFALIRLSGKSSITPVAMDKGGISQGYEDLPSKDNLWPIGFGRLFTDGPSAPDLLHVNVDYVKQDECGRRYGGNGRITSNMMCAADIGQDSCQGDSGGPLYDTDNETLVGIVSWGRGCADSRFPGVYSRISSQISWIEKTICAEHSSPKPDFCASEPEPPEPPTCVDTPGWYGRFGSRYNCRWYSQGNRCARYGGNERFRNFGKIANEACCACGKESSRSAAGKKSNSMSEDHLPSPTPDTTKPVLGSKSSTSDAIILDLAEWLRTECIKSTTDTTLMIEYATMFHDLGLDSAYAIKDLLDTKTLHEFSWMKSFHKRAVENCLV